MIEASTNISEVDVAIVGGSLAGAATAILLLRERPLLRVLLIEKSSAFERRVGEATVEISGYFLGRVLGLTQHLNEAHLVKQGMRFWFANSQTATLEDCSEIGPRYQVRLPSYQVDRSVLDEEVLRRACAIGARLLRPAKATRIELQAGGQQMVHIEGGGETRTLRCRWVVDASGFVAQLARQEGWYRPNEAHPTCAVWARWRGVKDWDDRLLHERYPEYGAACFGIRGTATNHLTGDGWWAWWIPLKGGDVSIGIVFDRRRLQFPKGGPLAQRLKDFLCQHPVGRELLSEAEPIAGDVHWRNQLPFLSEVIAGDGFVLVGDAAGFLDPLYSPGMDWVTYTVSRAADLILAQSEDAAFPSLIERHNQDFRRSYRRWFEAIYQNKYDYLGEYDLLRIAFALDLGLFYYGIVSQPYKRGAVALREPVYMTPPSTPFYYFMRHYNRRFAAIGRARRARQMLGRKNAGRRFLFPGFSLEKSTSSLIWKSLFAWFLLELREGWRTWFRSTPTERLPMHSGVEDTATASKAPA